MPSSLEVPVSESSSACPALPLLCRQIETGRMISMVVKIGLAAAAAAFALTGGTASAGKNYVSSKGEWTLNVAETKYPAGFPNIHNHVMQVTADDGKALQYTDNFAIGDGPMQHVSLDGAF